MTEENKEIKNDKKEKEPTLQRRVEKLEEFVVNMHGHVLKEVQTQLIKLGRGFGRTVNLEHRIGD